MRIVPKIEPGTDRREVLATTYQMRNCFKQFADGVASELDVHCYFQHAFAADLVPTGGKVLDVCCGRGLLIPFLRYRGTPSLYVGVDLHPQNAKWKDGADPRRESEQKDWGFSCVFVESNAAEMAQAVNATLPDTHFDTIVYTSAIEHMQPEAQRLSLIECGKLASPTSRLYLTCPVSQEGQGGYNCQYAAHVYEPSIGELSEWLRVAGWVIKQQVGLSTGMKHVRATLTGRELSGAEYIYKIMPREQALPTIAALYPRAAQEMAFVCTR